MTCMRNTLNSKTALFNAEGIKNPTKFDSHYKRLKMNLQLNIGLLLSDKLYVFLKFGLVSSSCFGQQLKEFSYISGVGISLWSSNVRVL